MIPTCEGRSFHSPVQKIDHWLHGFKHFRNILNQALILQFSVFKWFAYYKMFHLQVFNRRVIFIIPLGGSYQQFYSLDTCLKIFFKVFAADDLLPFVKTIIYFLPDFTKLLCARGIKAPCGITFSRLAMEVIPCSICLLATPA